MKTFITAVPLFDSNMSVTAYRLCDHNAERLLGISNDYQEMGDRLIAPGLSLVEKTGAEPFTGGKPLFVELNEYLLMMGYPLRLNIPAKDLVCIISSAMPQDEFLLTKCRDLLRAGYALGLDGFPLHAPECALLDMVQVVVLDTHAKDYKQQIKAMMPHLVTKQVLLTNVKNAKEFDKCNCIPNAIYWGGFYSQPITRGDNAVSPLKVNALQLLKNISEEDFDLNEIAKVVERDPSISIALLRFINSPALKLHNKVSSIQNAVAILGQKELRRWVTVAISVSLAEDRPSELTKLSLVRAKFAESLAPAYFLGTHAPALFMAGLFSLLDVILELPMEDAVNEISVNENVKKALVNKSGPLYEVLDLIYAYERADWDKVTINIVRNQISPDKIIDAFVNSLIWYKELLGEIDAKE